MLTVDCRNVESIKHELLVYVSDQIGAIPAIKSHEFVLSSIDDEGTINAADVIASIREFLDSIGEQRNFAVILQQDVVLIKSITGKALERDAPQTSVGMYSCPHCGFITRYEVEYNEHKKIHYV